jgi:hypothetical protein
MKPEMIMYRHAQIVDNLRRLPRKMLQLHGRDNVTDFVLHELCSKDCFNIPKAAYFIDNPAFNCLKGVVGVSGAELSSSGNIWERPEEFIEKMAQSPFNQKVRSFTYYSRKKRNHPEEAMAETIAKELGLTDYGFYSWDMKHDNHGFLVCEKDMTPNCDHAADDVIVDGLCLLSFCPIY